MLNSNLTIRQQATFKGALLRFWLRVRKGMLLLSESRMALVGLALFSVVVFIAIFAPWLATHDPVIGDFFTINAPASTEHYMGTDSLGRDIWSRIVYGARKVILVAGITIPAQMIMGIIFGGLAGYKGGKTDNFIMRINDACLAFPGLVLFLALLAVIGVGLWQCMFALTIGWTPSLVRMIRGLVLVERERDYVKAAKLIGESDIMILFRQIIPNVSSPLIVLSTIRTGGTILAFASLTFLGLGPPPPDPSWGLMLNEAQDLMETAPMVAIWPGMMIFITVLGVNLLGDGLRDIFDPRLAEK
ncbi:MAG: ABC transporter permease [Deltaproteobacteria bacterium]|nr:ABC transporter permease [Deltaproteobacteria bacterium]MBT6499099.1 ABC transporter permease [Deltaproteobacteria bacterium]MBT6611140.1 ABC transporter permease [Deltaproteobacteria bacterium]MBT7155308.1 ABC transporter permease [Deltaproteobacteria bacterium]MBT7710133.1 ABC transporter permease [Deltaproteobacteria bacterium]